MRVQTFIIVIALSFGLDLPCFGQNSTGQRAPSILKSSGRLSAGQSLSTAAPAATKPASQLLESRPPESARKPIAIKTVVPVSHVEPVASSQPAAPSQSAAVAPAVVDGSQLATAPGRVSQVVDLQPPAARIPAQTAAASRGVQLEPLMPMNASPVPQAFPTATPDSGLLLLQPIMPRTSTSTAQSNSGTNVPYEVLQMTKLTSMQNDKPAASTSSTATLSTEAMIGPMNDPSAMFSKLNTTPVPAVEPLSPVRTQLGQVQWAPDVYTWVTPTFFHKPLYFEQPNLERYGMGTYRWLQPAASSAHFFSSIALLPYKALTQHPCEHVYTLGFDRPGNCAAFQGRPLLGQSSVGEVLKVYDPYSGY